MIISLYILSCFFGGQLWMQLRLWDDLHLLPCSGLGCEGAPPNGAPCHSQGHSKAEAKSVPKKTVVKTWIRLSSSNLQIWFSNSFVIYLICQESSKASVRRRLSPALGAIEGLATASTLVISCYPRVEIRDPQLLGATRSPAANQRCWRTESPIPQSVAKLLRKRMDWL